MNINLSTRHDGSQAGHIDGPSIHCSAFESKEGTLRVFTSCRDTVEVRVEAKHDLAGMGDTQLVQLVITTGNNHTYCLDMSGLGVLAIVTEAFQQMLDSQTEEDVLS